MLISRAHTQTHSGLHTDKQTVRHSCKQAANRSRLVQIPAVEFYNNFCFAGICIRFFSNTIIIAQCNASFLFSRWSGKEWGTVTVCHFLFLNQEIDVP